MDLYREEVMDHYEHPRNMGSFGDAQDKDVLKGGANNASCGDRVEFYIKLKVTNDKGQIIERVKWRGEGCAIMMASASKLSEYLQGQTLQDIRDMSEEELAKKAIGFEINPGRVKCMYLPVIVIMRLLKQYI